MFGKQFQISGTMAITVVDLCALEDYFSSLETCKFFLLLLQLYFLGRQILQLLSLPSDIWFVYKHCIQNFKLTCPLHSRLWHIKIIHNQQFLVMHSKIMYPWLLFLLETFDDIQDRYLYMDYTVELPKLLKTVLNWIPHSFPRKITHGLWRKLHIWRLFL